MATSSEATITPGGIPTARQTTRWWAGSGCGSRGSVSRCAGYRRRQRLRGLFRNRRWFLLLELFDARLQRLDVALVVLLCLPQLAQLRTYLVHFRWLAARGQHCPRRGDD